MLTRGAYALYATCMATPPYNIAMIIRNHLVLPNYPLTIVEFVDWFIITGPRNYSGERLAQSRTASVKFAVRRNCHIF